MMKNAKMVSVKLEKEPKKNIGVKTVNRNPSQKFFKPNFCADLATINPENKVSRILKVTETLKPKYANGALKMVNIGFPQ